MKKKKTKRKLNIQKLFCFISFIFIIVCCLWYGGRAIYFYLESKKAHENKNKVLSQTIIEENYKKNKNFKELNNDYYFYNDANNNYLTYSNLNFRIIKVNKNNEITIISDTPITSLSFGKNKTINNSYITKWLNKEKDKTTGILQDNLNNITKYLVKSKICSDNITNIKKTTCKKIIKNKYISLLSITDYINTGGKKSFINNNYYTYLTNNKNDDIWYINDEGTLETNDGTDIYGVKFTLTLNPTTTIIEGNGTKDKPYKIEDKTKYFASYVKLDNDIWRVYEENENTLKLSLTNYLKRNNNVIQHNYSNDNYIHNDTIYGSLAYYLNNTYLNNLSYKDIIIEDKYYNYYYGKDNNYNYEESISKTIDTKVANLSIGNPFLNDLDNYFIATSPNKNDSSIYTTKKDYTLEETDVEEEKNIIPCITIKKDNLKKGNGTISDPYRME